MKSLLLTLTLASAFAPSAFADQKIQFFCDSTNVPTYEFPIDQNGSVTAVTNGHFSKQLSVNEVTYRNGDVSVQLIPFHPYCSVVIDYLNVTNNIFMDTAGPTFSRSADIGTSCEGGPVRHVECSIEVAQ